MKGPLTAVRQQRALDALGNPVRRDMLRLLSSKEHSVGELAAHFPISRPAVSKHLRVLEDAGLVERTAQGTSSLCRLKARGFEEAREWIDRFWDEALGRFQLLAENTSPQPARPESAERPRSANASRSISSRTETKAARETHQPKRIR